MVNQQHGMRHTSEYEVWKHIKQRVSDTNSSRYADYGGRGIMLYKPWATSFAAFYDYIGPRPSKEHTLDRWPDNNGNYEPGNVAWRTYRQQNNNKRNNVNITFNDQTKTAKEWATEVGLSYATVMWRYHQGWAVEQVLSPRLIPHKERRW